MSSRVVDPELTDNIAEDVDALEETIVNDTPSFEMPEKFRGKSAEEIAQAHLNLERHAGQQSNELGTLRKQVNQLLETQASTEKPAEPLQVDSLLDNPSDSIRNEIDHHPRLQEIERKLATEDLNRQKSAFEQRHPNWRETMSSQGFEQWIHASPVRTKMLEKADQDYMYSLADELFSTYADIHNAKSEQAAIDRNNRKASDLQAAGTINKGASGTTTKRYRRSDLVNLRVNNPEKYDAMQSEIYAAYAEGRVIT